MNKLEKLGWRKCSSDELSLNQLYVDKDIYQVYVKEIRANTSLNPEITLYRDIQKVEFNMGNGYCLTTDELSAITELMKEYKEVK